MEREYYKISRIASELKLKRIRIVFLFSDVGTAPEHGTMSIAQSDCFRGTESGAIVKIFQRKQASFGALDRYFENKESGV